MTSDDAAAVIAGNVYDKYGTRNPIARRLMAGFEHSMVSLLEAARGASTVLEVGCGEGHVTARLARLFPEARVVGSDVSPEIVARARSLHPDLEFRVQSVYDADPAEAFDLVVASEVLEHLEEPERALRSLAQTARRHLFVSVPREPLWRLLNLLRAHYVRDLGNTPGHLQHWSRRSFLRMLEQEVEVLDVRAPLPWTQALCRPRSAP